MPPRSPLPQRHGLDAAWIRTPDRDPYAPAAWATMRDFLVDRLPDAVPVDARLESGDFVNQAGQPWTGGEPYRANAFIWFHRPLHAEPVVPFTIEVLHQDARIVVVDKPHFLATTPNGTHVRETVLVRLRESLALPELTPAHRLDRLTAGVLVLTTQREHRGVYGTLFQTHAVDKAYEALAPYDPALELPCRVTNRIEKHRGSLQAEVVAGEPNAVTVVEVLETRGEVARYRLTPTTGKTHQLRVHMAALGLPILGDSLYPTVLNVAPDDFIAPLQLVARSLRFTDPVDQTAREYTSRFALTWPEAAR